MLQNIFALNKYIPEFKKLTFIANVILRNLVIIGCIYIVVLFLQNKIQQSFIRLCLTTAVTTFILTISTYLFILNNNERSSIKNKIQKILSII